MKMVLRRIFDGFERGDIVVLDSHFLIGRGKDCQLRPRGLFVANRHCEITLGHATATLTHHAGPRFPTLVNGQRVLEMHSLLSGDVLNIGIATYRVLLAQDATNCSKRASDSGSSLPLLNPGFAGQLP